MGIDQMLVVWSVNLKESTKSIVSRIRTKHCVDMAMKGTTLASINKSQIYFYNFASDQN